MKKRKSSNERDARLSDASVSFASLKSPFPMLTVQDGVVVCGAVSASTTSTPKWPMVSLIKF
jgi:hypothetical protein